jgi:hypothetical protein
MKTKIAWAAGIVDGEGSITAGWYQHHPWGTYLHLAITVRMCDKRAVKFIHQVLGVGTVVFRPSKIKNRRDIWCWKATSQEAASAIRKILPFLVTKKEQALIFLEITEEMKNRQGKGTNKLTAKRKRFQDVRVKRLKEWKRRV